MQKVLKKICVVQFWTPLGPPLPEVTVMTNTVVPTCGRLHLATMSDWGAATWVYGAAATGLWKSTKLASQRAAQYSTVCNQLTRSETSETGGLETLCHDASFAPYCIHFITLAQPLHLNIVQVVGRRQIWTEPKPGNFPEEVTMGGPKTMLRCMGSLLGAWRILVWSREI